MVPELKPRHVHDTEQMMTKKILIADDEPFIRTLLWRALEELEEYDVELTLATDGEEALTMAQSDQPDLIFLDVMMPQLNGYEVCEQLKASHPTIYIILLTAKGQAVDKLRGTDAGADEYITKPFNPDYVLSQAAKILDITLE